MSPFLLRITEVHERKLLILFILLIPAFVIELQTGNIPLVHFLNPVTFVFLATFGYGFLVLAIREIVVRYDAGLLSILLLGIAYGLYNEGLVAGTLTRTVGVPVATFDGGLMVAGLNIGFTAVILVVHALQAVLYPILFSHIIFPRYRTAPLLRPRTVAILVGTSLLFGVIMFLRREELPVAFVAIVAGMLLFVFLAYCARRRSVLVYAGAPQKNDKYFGALAFLLFFIPSLIATVGASSMLPSVATGVLSVCAYWYIVRKTACSAYRLAAIGVYHLLFSMVFGALFVIGVNPGYIVMVAPGYAIVALFLTVYMMRKIRRASVE